MSFVLRHWLDVRLGETKISCEVCGALVLLLFGNKVVVVLIWIILSSEYLLHPPEHKLTAGSLRL